ncbi:hypothetical protein [Pandoraea sputorum]|uniref:hypothetical protein n=1 Tax=Pandoraea sputorum TaxID=93222 RepID=UPI001241DA8E|nr:hypothetical protein [Pandoraea sputorum]
MPIRYPEFGQRVLAAMQESGTDVQGIVNFFKARGIKITYEMVRRYTLGQAMPRPDKIALLAQAVGKGASELQFGDAGTASNSANLTGIGASNSIRQKGDSLPWLFRFERERFDRLSSDRKRKIELLVLGQIAEWEEEDKRENQHAG